MVPTVFSAAPPVCASLLQHLNADGGRRATVPLPMWPVTTGFYTGLRRLQMLGGAVNVLTPRLLCKACLQEQPPVALWSGNRCPGYPKQNPHSNHDDGAYRRLPTVVDLDLHNSNSSISLLLPVFKGDLQYYLDMMSFSCPSHPLRYIRQLKL